MQSTLATDEFCLQSVAIPIEGGVGYLGSATQDLLGVYHQSPGFTAQLLFTDLSLLIKIA